MDKKPDQTNKKDCHDHEEMIQKLEQETCCDGRRVFKYQGLWCSTKYLQTLLSFQEHFRAQPLNVVLATSPKSGTTWLKALAFAITTRHLFPIDRTPLLTSNPHELVRYLEIDVSWEKDQGDWGLQKVQYGSMVFSTHMLYEMLPESILNSNCKIVYICRNPLDQFVSFHHFLIKNRIEKDAAPLELEVAVDKFCQGIHPQGPFWDHVLGYWNAHLKNPEKVLFLKYEDLKEDICLHVRKIAEFMGFPFSSEEERRGLVEKIASLCSFDNLRSLDVNKKGKLYGVMEKSSYFRKGEVGDWKNFLTPGMSERIKNTMESKLMGSGLSFQHPK